MIMSIMNYVSSQLLKGHEENFHVLFPLKTWRSVNFRKYLGKYSVKCF